MDYTSIRQLFYKERSSLDDFDVLAEDENVFVNSFLYNRLLQIDYLHPKYDYANEETLRIFNDVYYFMTLFFRDKNPLMHYADYRKIPNPEQNKDKLSQYRTWVEFSMIYVIMVRWNNTNWFNGRNAHAKVFQIIEDEINSYMENCQSDLDDNIAFIITNRCEYHRYIMSIDHDFPMRNIQEVIDSKESLKSCLLVGSVLRNVVNEACKDKTQKLALIERLLEPEKEEYGVYDSLVSSAYRSLHELKSELTGEPLPEELPFEKATSFTIPMRPTPPSNQNGQNERMADDRDARIAELKKEVGLLKEKLSAFQYASSEEKMSQTEKLDSESDGYPQELSDALKKIEEQKETIKDLEETISRFQMRGLPPAKRKGIALGLTPQQADIFGDFLANKLGIVFENKKKDLSLILNCLFGHGKSSLANKMHMITGAVNDRLYVASIFGPFSTSTAKSISSDWTEDTLAPWEEEVEHNDENNDESD